MRYAVINNGTVENVIEASPGFTLPDRLLVEADEQVAAGWQFSNGEFSPPEPASPAVRFIAPYDFLGLFAQGELLNILQSIDPVILIARAKIQTITGVVDLQSAETQQYVGYLQMQQIITPERASRILSGRTPE